MQAYLIRNKLFSTVAKAFIAESNINFSQALFNLELRNDSFFFTKSGTPKYFQMVNEHKRLQKIWKKIFTRNLTNKTNR